MRERSINNGVIANKYSNQRSEATSQIGQASQHQMLNMLLTSKTLLATEIDEELDRVGDEVWPLLGDSVGELVGIFEGTVVVFTH